MTLNQSPEPAMKIRVVFTLLIAMVLLGGCSSPKFTGYSGSEVFQGNGGGTEKTVDDIQFWAHGEPGRRYRILGVIDHGHKHGHFSSFGSTDSAMAKVARAQGGDAIIVVTKDQEPTSEDLESLFGNWSHRSSTTLVVIKFVE
jgi:hypothetical protein